MAKIIVSANVTVDGIVQDPTGEEETSRGGWFAQVGPADREAFGQAALEEAVAAEAFLMGRRTYEFLASRWPARTGPLADRLSTIPKYVVSESLDQPAWNNTIVIQAPAATRIIALKRQIPGDIIVPASFELVQTLVEHDLVDELRIMVYPVVLGSGRRLFDHLANTIRLRLLDNRTLGDHLTQASYEITREQPRM